MYALIRGCMLRRWPRLLEIIRAHGGSVVEPAVACAEGTRYFNLAAALLAQPENFAVLVRDVWTSERLIPAHHGVHRALNRDGDAGCNRHGVPHPEMLAIAKLRN